MMYQPGRGAVRFKQPMLALMNFLRIE